MRRERANLRVARSHVRMLQISFLQCVDTQFTQTCRKKSNDDAFMRNQIFEAFTLANEMRVNAINHHLTRSCTRVVV